MTFRKPTSALACVIVLGVLAGGARLGAHDGPPFPIVSNQVAGPYQLSVWTDPDTTDDGTSGGQFWVTVRSVDESAALHPDTRATISIHPAGREQERHTGRTEPVNGDVSNQFVALPMDHEGLFAVRVTLEGPAGLAEVSSQVEATYDLRPPAGMIVLYVMPFLLLGVLWLKLLLRRRKSPTPSRPH